MAIHQVGFQLQGIQILMSFKTKCYVSLFEGEGGRMTQHFELTAGEDPRCEGCDGN